LSIIYRCVEDLSTLELIVDLEIKVWGLEPRDAAPANLLHAIVDHGGVLIAAEADNEPIGLCLAFPARQGKDWMLWSHMAAVHPQYQGQGIGFQLKQMQRQWAIKQGYKRIGWTFDPLQRTNAHFNIRKLGAQCSKYLVNYYGEMTDSINSGMPSDRLEVSWILEASKSDTKESFQNSSVGPMVKADRSGAPLFDESAMQHKVLSIEIPSSISDLKRTTPEIALAWRLTVRRAMQEAFSRNYTIVDFVSGNDHSYYVLQAATPWWLYVVRCNDDSYYTGITVNLDRRIHEHNSGKGAAYTAARKPVQLIASWQFPSQSGALRAEAAFKRLSRQQKSDLIQQKVNYREGLFCSL
jgi:predicted GNAT superfamily acetyltransferase/predicted GIY-YIG superfamily endonuclease